VIPPFKLKNVTTPGYKPPATWEEFRDLDRPERIIAARFFLREAAIRLHDFGLRPDEIINAFNGAPEWISRQLHGYRRELKELRKDWVCRIEECKYVGEKHEFFAHMDQLNLLEEVPMARCPECGLCDAEELVEEPEEEPEEERVVVISDFGMPGVEPEPLGEIRKLPSKPPLEEPEFSFKGVDAPYHRSSGGTVVAQNIDSKAPGYVGVVGACADCEGQACPVCQGMGEDAIIKDHHCELCQTTFCKQCHGIVRAQLSRAYDEVRRCRCGGDEG
jgi:hypothetical protein